MIKESSIINQLKQQFPLEYGIGDDAAIIPFNNDQYYLISKDLLIEDIHFKTSYFDPYSLAYKSLQVNISDIAAMGGKALYVILGVAIDKNMDQNYLNYFLDAFSNISKEYNIELIGGDTTGSKGKFYISITIIGVASKNNIKLRSKAQIGDVICIAGNIGYSHIGLLALQNNIDDLEEFKKAHLRPQALFKEGEWIGEQKAVTSMMDISDGLLVDLQKLCDSSKLSANLKLEQLRYNNKFADACTRLGLTAEHVKLIGGEDYGLLLTINPDYYQDFKDEFFNQFGYELQYIGMMTDVDNGNLKDYNMINLKPFSHFGEL